MKSRKVSWYALLLILAAVTAFLVSSHYVKAYSDPVGWLLRAESMARGDLVTERAPLYPAFLILALKALGPVNVFLSNLPFLLLLLVMTYIVTRESLYSYGRESGESNALRNTAALLAVAILVLVNKGLFLELLNPFREALAFTLITASVLALMRYLDGRKSTMLVSSGVILGLSVGVRETGVLVLPAYLLLYLYHAFWRRDIPWFRAAALFLGGLALGLLPLMVQNALHTGQFWLPSYAASRFQGESALKLPADFPVPGMSFSYFATTGRETVALFREKYGVAAMVLLVLSLIQCVRKRYLRMLLLVLPAALTTLLFYCLYWYVKARYLFMVDIFLVPLMAPGALLLMELVCRAGRASCVAREKTCELAAAVLLVVVVSSSLAVDAAGRSARFKVWDVQEMRAAVEPRLKSPYSFIAGSRHHRQMMSWFFQVPYAARDVRLPADLIREEGFEAAMKQQGGKLMADYKKTNVYSYGRQFLLKNWFDFEEAFSFAELSRPPDRYGRPLQGSLYLVKPWSKKEIVRKVPSGGESGRKVLMVDLFRLWDYPGRTWCRLFVNGKLVEERVPAGVHFVDISEAAGGSAVVKVLSDGPLPEDPYFEVFDPDSGMEISLGAGPSYWYYPFLSDHFYHSASLKSDAVILFDEGEITVPNAASPDSEVYAIFAAEFYQEDPYFQKENFLFIDIGGREQRRKLPARRKIDFLTVRLGRGCGRVEYVRLKLRTTLPSRQKQVEMRREDTINRHGYVKLSMIHLTTIPSVLEGALSIDVGSAEDGPWLLEGFFPRERHSRSVPVRWTESKASVRIPHSKTQEALRVRIRIIEARPESVRADPSFVVDGLDIPGSAVEKSMAGEGVTEYIFLVPPGSKDSAGERTLVIASSLWTPAEVTGSRDRRELGILIDRIELIAEKGGLP